MKKSHIIPLSLIANANVHIEGLELHFGHFEKIGIKDLLLHCAHTDSRTVFLVVFNCRTFASMGIITSMFLVF